MPCRAHVDENDLRRCCLWSGWYWVDPTQGSIDDAIQVWCNMTNTIETCIYPTPKTKMVRTDHHACIRNTLIRPSLEGLQFCWFVHWWLSDWRFCCWGLVQISKRLPQFKSCEMFWVLVDLTLMLLECDKKSLFLSKSCVHTSNVSRFPGLCGVHAVLSVHWMFR